MGSFRQIAAELAGPDALGILAPPGRRTILLLRPRSLEMDLVLLLRPDSDVFRELTPAQAAAGAETVLRALQEWAAGAPGAIEPVAREESGYQLRASIGSFSFLVCPRLPNQPYQPLVCANLNAAHEAADALGAALCPPAGCEREIYLNTHHFSR